MEVSIENANENGYVMKEEDFSMVTHDLSCGKKIKLKINLNYVGTLRDRIGLMSLKVTMKITQNSIFTEKAIFRSITTAISSPKTIQATNRKKT